MNVWRWFDRFSLAQLRRGNELTANLGLLFSLPGCVLSFAYEVPARVAMGWSLAFGIALGYRVACFTIRLLSEQKDALEIELAAARMKHLN